MTLARFTAAALAMLVLAACGRHDQTAWTAEPAREPSDRAAEAGYLAPPMVTAVAGRPGRGLALEGRAAPGARVRLAPPSGAALFTSAGEDGRWSLVVPGGARVRLFGLSMTAQERVVQSEGYLMLAAEGHAAQLRAGAGALLLAAASREPLILAVDYDNDGGAVVSGVAAPGAALSLRIDQSPRGETRADGAGRFSISLTEPLEPGAHAVEVSGEGGEDEISVEADRVGEVGPGPFNARRTPYGWRVDWVTPGGGVQTTQLFERQRAGA